MRVQISRWGNSAGLRIPKAFAESLGLDVGRMAEMYQKNGRLVIEPCGEGDSIADVLAGEIDLKSMTDKISAQNMPDVDDTVPVGREIW